MLVQLQVGKFLTTGCGVGGGLSALPRLWKPTSWHRRSRVVGIPLAMAVSGHGRSEEHYNVLGVSRFATFDDIKKAYRLLARKWHPDVNKDPQAGDVFKNVRLAYEVLSNEATRSQYDRELKSREGFGGSTGYMAYSSDLEDFIRIYTWTELRQKIRQKRYPKQYKNNRNRSFFYCELDEENRGKTSSGQRGSFMQALESAFISLFLMQTIGCGLSLTFSSLMALFDAKLDGGYKLAYVVAWCLGGKGGILLTLFLSFASWAFGKSNSGTVVVVLVAMWIGSTLASCCPIPQGVLCDRRVPLKLKGKVYRAVVRPALLYGSECWPITKRQEQKLLVTEMRMLRWMCGHTRLDRVRNEVIRSRVGVAAISDKLRESRLRWLGHVLRRHPSAPVRKCESLFPAHSRRGRGRPKKSWREIIGNDFALLNLTEDLAQDRAIWRERTRVLE